MREKISDYITALATSATALFAWLAYRYAVESADPIVECDEPQWQTGNKQLFFPVTVRNRSAVSYGISKVEIRRPKGSTISVPDFVPAQMLILSRQLRPIGTVGHSLLDHHFDAATTTLALIIKPPASFVSGKLRIKLTVSDKSIRPRQRRLVVKKFIPAAKTKMIADTINKTD